MKIDTILDFIDQGTISLPEFQRGYVWNRKQVKQMMDSLYRKYPVGSFLIWTTKSETANVRGNQPVTTDIKLLLDGQQRVTSLYGIIRGTPPPFFDGNSRAFEDLYFHLEDEIFEFYMKMKMQDNPLWINVTSLMQNGIAAAYKRLKEIPELTDEQENEYINRLSAIIDIRQREFHIDEVTGKDKNVDVVVEIFNKVNSGGTKLSQGDLAMAKICAMWPDARDEMKSHLHTWGTAGYSFSLDWLLRCINAVLTGRSKFTAFEEVSCLAFQAGMEKTVRFINTALNMIASKLGLDNNSVLGGKFAIAAMARYLELNNGRVDSPQKIGKLLYWYTHSFLWGRYAGAVESNLRQDLVALEEEGDPLDNMIRQLRQQRGNLDISPEDFRGWSRGARFYPLLYMLTRMNHANDWYSELELSSSLLGRQARLHLHHIFPKAKLYKHEYLIHQVNALPNFTFLTEETNLRVSDRDPSEYLSEIEDAHPGILESHWIPMDRDLWKYENYTEFLEQRRTLLAEATNSFLSGLLTDMTPYTPEVVALVGGIATDEEELRILEVCGWLEENGLYIGELEYEILADDGETCIGILDVAWPEGIQRGLSEPVALLLDEPKEIEQAAGKGGFRFFTSIEDLKQYVEKEILALDISDVS